jgi:hypothetical protein
VFSLVAIAALGETGERIAAKQADHGRAERHVLRMTYQPFPVHRSLVSLSPSTGIRSCRRPRAAHPVGRHGPYAGCNGRTGMSTRSHRPVLPLSTAQ